MTIYNVKDFGAVGNGTTDDRLAIQAAVNAAREDGGGEVYIPPGVYAVTGQFVDGKPKPTLGCIQLYDNITVTGAGMGESVVKVKNGWNGDITGIFRTPYGIENHDVTVQGLTLDGNRANTTGDIIGWFNGVKPGAPGTDTNITLDYVEIMNCETYGFDPHERTTNLVITNSISHDNGLDGFTLDFQIDGRVNDNIAYNNGRHGFNVVTSTYDLEMTGNIAYGNGGNGITVQRGSEDIAVPKNILIQGGRYYDNGKDGIQINKADLVLIDAVDIYGNAQRGVRIMGSVGSTVQNSTIHDNSQSKDAGYDEIYIQSYDDREGDSGRIYVTKDTLISNNSIFDTGSVNANYGIREANDGTDYTTLQDNTITGTNNDILLFGSHSTDGDTGSPPPDDIEGTSGADTMTGTDSNDVMWGLGGNDQLTAKSGDDTLYGGDGADKLYGNAGKDVLYGGSGDDSLNGGSGDDKLYGDAGNDRLIGEKGNDLLTGGAGKDKFQFAGEFGLDIVADFIQGSDRLSISALLADNFGEFQDHVTVSNGKTVITFGTNVVELAGFTNTLTSADVIFYS